MLFWTSLVMSGLVAAAAAVVLGFGLAKSDMLHLVPYPVMWAVGMVLILLWLAIWLARK